MTEARKLLKLFISALVYGLLCGPAAASEWRVIDSDSHIAFHGSMLGVPVIGYFRHFESRITFDPDDLENAHLSIMIDMTSVDSAHAERDTALKLPEWFAVQSYATAEFAAKAFRRTGNGNGTGTGDGNGNGNGTYEATGTLTIKRMKKEITLPFSLVIDGDGAIVLGEIDLNRRDFDIGAGDWANERLVAFAVRVEFRIVAERLDAR